MAISAPTVRQPLSADALFGLLRTGCADIADHRPGTPDIALTDARMAAFACSRCNRPRCWPLTRSEPQAMCRGSTV